MVAVITKISDYAAGGWRDASARDACSRLERGEILFFAATPFDLPQPDRPGLCHIVALNYHWDRIGQSVLHAFFAVSCRTSTKALFEPTALLAPALLTLLLLWVLLAVRRSTVTAR